MSRRFLELVVSRLSRGFQGAFESLAQFFSVQELACKIVSGTPNLDVSLIAARVDLSWVGGREGPDYEAIAQLREQRGLDIVSLCRDQLRPCGRQLVMFASDRAMVLSSF